MRRALCGLTLVLVVLGAGCMALRSPDEPNRRIVDLLHSSESSGPADPTGAGAVAVPEPAGQRTPERIHGGIQ